MQRSQRLKPTKSKAQRQGAQPGAVSYSTERPPLSWTGDPALTLANLLGSINTRWPVDGICLLSLFIVYAVPTLVDDLVVLRRHKKGHDPRTVHEWRLEGYDIILVARTGFYSWEHLGPMPSTKILWGLLHTKYGYPLGPWKTVDRRLRRIERRLRLLDAGELSHSDPSGRRLLTSYPLACQYSHLDRTATIVPSL
jgi:hypothetical protein